MANFTIAKETFFAVKGNDTSNVIEIATTSTHEKAQIVVELLQGDEAVKLNQVFSSIKTTLQSSNHSDIGPDEKIGDTTKFILEEEGIRITSNSPELLSIDATVSSVAIPGKYTLKVSVIDLDNPETVEENLVKDIELSIVTIEEALNKYENQIEKMSNEDIAQIETDYQTLEQKRQIVLAAITALSDEENATVKKDLMDRYYVAAENQYKALRLIIEYRCAGNVLELEKVENVGGDKPYRITYNGDKIKLGSATEAYAFYPAGYKATLLKISGYPDDEPDNIISHLVPTQTTWLVSNTNPVGGDFLLAFKIQDPETKEDKWYKSTFKVSSDGTILESVNGITVDVDSEGEETIIKKHTDKTGLTAAIKIAKDLIDATTVGTNIGQASQTAIDTIKEAVKTAEEVKNSVADYASYTDTEAFNALQKQLDDAKDALNDAISAFQEAIVSDSDYAEAKLVDYETSAQKFLENIRKKIRI